jgi:hypothetical protein
VSKDVLESLRNLLAHRTEDPGCYEFVLECWIESAANEIERLRYGWVLVIDRLPPDGETVLWYDPEDTFCKFILGKKDGDGVDWGGDLNCPLAAFTHWRHLPGPPSAVLK